jgi:DeoR/GlpR family transcriptional regulator of sugar metabolism
VVVVADASNVGRATVARICEVAAVDELIIDNAADPAILDSLRVEGASMTVV